MAPLGPKNPSTTFFWNDWDNDEALKACSLAAQGLWMRMLCIAARSPEPGIVMIGGFPASRPDLEPRLAALVGQPLETVNALIDELLTSGAASLDRKKRIVNRRMMKAAALRRKRSEAGKLGADVTHGKTTEMNGLPGQNASKPHGKPPPLQDSLMNPLSSKTSTDAGREAQRDGSARLAPSPSRKQIERNRAAIERAIAALTSKKIMSDAT